MKNFNWEAFKKGSIAVLCVNRKDYDSFMQHCENEGLKWASGELPTQWKPPITKQVVIIGEFGVLSYSSKHLANTVFFDVVKFSDKGFSEKADEETPQKKPLGAEFILDISIEQAFFTEKVRSMSEKYDISFEELMRKVIAGFEDFYEKEFEK